MAKERGQRKRDDGSKAVKERLWQIEDEWMEARLRGDAESTRALLDDSYKGATSAGRAQSKAEFVKSVEGSTGFFKEHVHAGRAIGIRGDFAISTGVATLLAPGHSHSFRYLRVFHANEGEWKLIASQSTPIA